MGKMWKLNKKTLLVVLSFCGYTLALPPCVCSRDKRPVCASNGQTFNNQCLLDCAAISNPDLRLLRAGACEQVAVANAPLPCFCNYNYAPVCGTDDKTYGNECALHCARSVSPALNMRHAGACSGAGGGVGSGVNVVDGPPSRPCACVRELKPVCGTNGSTYNNLCLLNCARDNNPGLELRHVGPCV